MTNSNANYEVEIRELVEARANAVRRRDVTGATSNVAPDIVSFDVVGILQRFGSSESRKRAEEWFASFDGPIGFEVSDVNITARENIAVCHSLNLVKAQRKEGGVLEMWWRSTVCYQKIDDRWMIAHEHNSVPFDPDSGKARIDLQP